MHKKYISQYRVVVSYKLDRHNKRSNTIGNAIDKVIKYENTIIMSHSIRHDISHTMDDAANHNNKQWYDLY